jgi:hypothetical protein
MIQSRRNRPLTIRSAYITQIRLVVATDRQYARAAPIRFWFFPTRNTSGSSQCRLGRAEIGTGESHCHGSRIHSEVRVDPTSRHTLTLRCGTTVPLQSVRPTSWTYVDRELTDLLTNHCWPKEGRVRRDACRCFATGWSLFCPGCRTVRHRVHTRGDRRRASHSNLRRNNRKPVPGRQR